MIRTSSAALFCLVLGLGCSDDGAEGDEPSARESSRHETTQSAQRRLDAQREATADARRELRESREDAKEAREDAKEARDDVRTEVQSLSAVVSRACNGLSKSERVRCPISGRSVAAVEDVRKGVSIRLTESAGDAADVEQRVECHTALRELDRAQAAATDPGSPEERPRATCVLDVDGVDTDVSERDGQTFVAVTTRNHAKRQEVRSLARRGVRNAPPLATTSGTVRR